jgi:hypothetical protein
MIINIIKKKIMGDNSNFTEIKELELHMYFFVPYQLTGIQKGIQCGHAALEYANKYGKDEEFITFFREFKTWVILDGGTTNDGRDFHGIAQGTLNQIADELLKNDIKIAYFQEPDLNDALTAVCFLADERVFNRKDYPDFVDWLIEKYSITNDALAMVKLRTDTMEILMAERPDNYKEWVRFVGGVKNVFLRELIKNKKLA